MPPWVALAAVFLLLAAATPASGQVEIPDQSDWVDHGTILRATGQVGDWNREYAGFGPCGMIRFGNPERLYLYYIGSDGDRRDDGGPRHRSLGVASCDPQASDCTQSASWSEHPGNPILRHQPNSGRGFDPSCGGNWGEEEGIFTCAVTVDGPNIRLYYGAMDNGALACSVIDEVKVVSSTSPTSFPDGLSGRTIIAFDDPNAPCHGPYGDEEDPIGVTVDPVDRTYRMYYSLGSVPACRDRSLGYAEGASWDDFPTKRLAIEQSGDTFFDGNTRINWLSDNVLAMLIDVPPFIEGPGRQQWFTASRPSFGAPRLHSTYTFDGSGESNDPVEVRSQVTYYDPPTQTWWMFYRDGNEPQRLGSMLRLKTAGPGTSGGGDPPPTPPRRPLPPILLD